MNTIKTSKNLTHYKKYQSKVEFENINSQTLLATDYLNHFNEVHMLIDMLPSMPDCIEDIREWSPQSYQEHFSNSVFAAKELAIDAYEHCPDEYRVPFEKIITKMDKLVLNTIALTEEAMIKGKLDNLQVIVDDYTPKMRKLIKICGAIINGEDHMAQQNKIDLYFNDNIESQDREGLGQSDIDDLFS